VDTGTAFSWLHRERLDRLGAQRLRKIEVRTIDGSIIERDTAVVWVGSHGRKVPDIVVVAEANDKELIGAYTIQGLALEYDPVLKKLSLTEIPAMAFIESLG
jgi:predicted aspartyl protease